MSGYTWAWVAWGLIFAGIEALALFNSRRGDTLSEHVWAFLGVRTDHWHRDRTNPDYIDPDKGRPKTPKWTLRVARLAVFTLLAWLAGHFLTGGALW